MKCNDCEFVRETISKEVLKILRKNVPHMVKGLKVGMVYCGSFHGYMKPKKDCVFYLQEVEEEEDW